MASPLLLRFCFSSSFENGDEHRFLERAVNRFASKMRARRNGIYGWTEETEVTEIARTYDDLSRIGRPAFSSIEIFDV